LSIFLQLLLQHYYQQLLPIAEHLVSSVVLLVVEYSVSIVFLALALDLTVMGSD